MSIFHFPRINVKGLLSINVGTANNDDYSSSQFPSGSPYAGQPVRLADSVNVKPLTYGKTDAEWNKWAVSPLDVYNPPRGAMAKPKITKGEDLIANNQLLPAEWNFYGDMGLTMSNVGTTAIADPFQTIPPALKAQISQAILSFNNRPGPDGRSTGMIIDINPEDVNSSQIIADTLSLESDGKFIFSGKPTKGVTRWINFQRNNSLTGSNGAAATFQMAIPLSDLAGQPILAGLPATSPEGNALQGIVFRFTLYRGLQPISVFKYPDNTQWMKKMMALYDNQGLNPDYAEIQGTIAPWFVGEPASAPAGRPLLATKNTIPVPNGRKGNGPQFQLSPAVVYINPKDNVVSVDFSPTFPDQYSGSYDPFNTGDNPKWDFGPLSLNVSYNGSVHTFQSIQYADTKQNDQKGGVFDFPFNPGIPGLKQMLEAGNFVVNSSQYGDLLAETAYFILSDASALYTDVDPAHPTTDKFLNETGVPVTTNFLLFKKGRLLTSQDPERLDLFYYDTTPNQSPGPLTVLQKGYLPGSPISLPVSGPGNRLITAVVSGTQPPPADYGQFDSVSMPIINVRILPYDDYSRYYVVPSASQPVGNASLTFEVLYNEVLRNYYLLYPGMSQRIPLNDPSYWNDAEMAGRLMQRTSLDFWGTALAMPRTRDLSQCRRTLVAAWCLKFFQQ